MSEKNADGTTTTAPPAPAPRRGKFLSGPPSAPPSAASASTTTTSPSKSQTRGKFLNSPASINTSPTTTTTTTAGINTSTVVQSNERSLTTLKQQIHQAKIVASTRRRAISSSRDEVFHDLEEAETIVLALLQCASETSDSLSKMTVARSRHHHLNNSEAATAGEGSITFEQLAAQVRSNGVGYLAGVTKLHQLLAPHASLVKSYRNHASTAAANNSQGEMSKRNDTTTITSEIASFHPNSSEIVKLATSNMYAARVEKRLAVERREILKEMIRLEEEGLKGSSSSDVVGELKEVELKESILSSNKRKR
mmetsp:Transcript_22809/g.37587  ORF Transcript_22809/g.37587 Transcript_22809/m.37587 type:complete len:309 (-) Transcript_22809:18-944(-)